MAFASPRGSTHQRAQSQPRGQGVGGGRADSRAAAATVLALLGQAPVNVLRLSESAQAVDGVALGAPAQPQSARALPSHGGRQENSRLANAGTRPVNSASLGSLSARGPRTPRMAKTGPLPASMRFAPRVVGTTSWDNMDSGSSRRQHSGDLSSRGGPAATASYPTGLHVRIPSSRSQLSEALSSRSHRSDASDHSAFGSATTPRHLRMVRAFPSAPVLRLRADRPVPFWVPGGRAVSASLQSGHARSFLVPRHVAEHASFHVTFSDRRVKLSWRRLPRGADAQDAGGEFVEVACVPTVVDKAEFAIDLYKRKIGREHLLQICNGACILVYPSPPRRELCACTRVTCCEHSLSSSRPAACGYRPQRAEGAQCRAAAS